MYPGFADDVRGFNAMYKLEPIDPSTYEALDQLEQFSIILGEELEEGVETVDRFHEVFDHDIFPDGRVALTPEQVLDLRTEVADWLGDIIVYCCTQAHRWGIPMAGVLRAIMESNKSKLGPDGEPIHDARGKVQKGPAFVPPEPAIRALLAGGGQNE